MGQHGIGGERERGGGGVRHGWIGKASRWAGTLFHVARYVPAFCEVRFLTAVGSLR